MKDFNFRMLTRVQFGSEKALKAVELARSLGAEKALILIDKPVYLSEYGQRILNSFESAGFE